MLKVSPAPHTFSGYSVHKMMYSVIVALIPALIVSVIVFGLPALQIILVSICASVFFEFAIQKWMLKVTPTVTDGSAVITGILLAFNLPSNLPLWMVVVGCLVAIGIGKMSFGGLGNNPFNPALVGRIFLLISFPVSMTTWPKPFTSSGFVDAVTQATPLGIMKEGIKASAPMASIMHNVPSYWNLFIGNIGGSLGETSALALLIGFIYLLYKKTITWHIPVSMVGSVFIFSGILWLFHPTHRPDPLFQILSGGVMLGAIFMATDYVTSPMTKKGMLIFGTLIGIITVIIRLFGAYPEGVSFAIVIMNAFVPLINRYCPPVRFGE